MLWVRCSFIHLKYSLRKEKADSGYPLSANVTSKRCRCHVISAKLKLFILVLMSQLPIRRYPLQSNRLSLD